MTNIEFLEKINKEKLTRLDLGTSLSFDSAIKYIEGAKEDFIYLFDQELNLSETEKELVGNYFRIYSQLITTVKEFNESPTESRNDSIRRRDKIINDFKKYEIEKIKSILPIVSRIKILELSKTTEVEEKEIEKVLKRIEESVDTKLKVFTSDSELALINFKEEAKKQKEEFEANIDTAIGTLDEANKLRKEAQDFPIDKLVEKYGDIFLIQAKRNKIIAICSSIIFVISLVGLIVLAVKLFQPLIDEINELSKVTDSSNTLSFEYIVTSVIFRVIILGLGLLVVKESLKNYNSNMHLYNMNMHRQNALQSFSTLISNTAGKEARDEIIKEISHTIYANQEDGYLQTGKKPLSLNEAIELFKAIK